MSEIVWYTKKAGGPSVAMVMASIAGLVYFPLWKLGLVRSQNNPAIRIYRKHLSLGTVHLRPSMGQLRELCSPPRAKHMRPTNTCSQEIKTIGTTKKVGMGNGFQEENQIKHDPCVMRTR